MIGRLIQTYRVDELLGEGGMGTVYRATDTMLERPVALKMLRPALLSQPQFLERFKSEAVTLAKLNHPNIATLYNFIREGDDYFMVMEYVEGQTLDQWLEQFGPLPYTLAIPIVMQALDGLQHAHKRNILHRDLKPANLMITPEGTVKIMDFGIARIMGSRRLTQVNRIIGTLEYMAPEQILGQEPLPQSDIYALGVVLYELIAGQVPLSGESEYNTMEKVMKETPAPLTHKIVGIPEALDQLLAKALQKTATDRFDSARAYMQALSNVVPYSQVLDEVEVASYQQPKQAIAETSFTEPLVEHTALFESIEQLDQPTQLLELPDSDEPVVISRIPGNELAPILPPSDQTRQESVKPKAREGKTVKIPVKNPVSMPETAQSTHKGLSANRIIGLVAAFVVLVLVGLYWLGKDKEPEKLPLSALSMPQPVGDSTLVANTQSGNSQPTSQQASQEAPTSSVHQQPELNKPTNQPLPSGAHQPITPEQRPGTGGQTGANPAQTTNQPAANTVQPTTNQPSGPQPSASQPVVVPANSPTNQPVVSAARPTDDSPTRPVANDRADEPTDANSNRPTKSKSLRLPGGTEVVVELAEPLAAANATDGQRVVLRVAKAVIVNGETVIERGASVDGEVTDVSTSGKKEMLEIRLETVRTISGKSLKLRSSTFKYVGDRNQPLAFKSGQQFIVYTASGLTL